MREERAVVTHAVQRKYKVPFPDLCTIADHIEDRNLPCLRNAHAADLNQFIANGILWTALPGQCFVPQRFVAVLDVGNLAPVILWKDAPDLAAFVHAVIDAVQSRYRKLLARAGIQT